MGLNFHKMWEINESDGFITDKRRAVHAFCLLFKYF